MRHSQQSRAHHYLGRHATPCDDHPSQRITSKIYSLRSQSSVLSSFPRALANNMARSKDKKRESENGAGDETRDESKIDEPSLDYDELVKRVCVIANPLAGRKLTKRLYKTVKKGERQHSGLREL